MAIKATPKPQPASNLLKELTKISSIDYIGMDKCNSCHKNIKRNQRAILCDKCNLWIHQQCSDMSGKSYKQNKEKKCFNWSCNKCRDEDELVTDLPEINLLTEKHS